jgi:hypothetical protein
MFTTVALLTNQISKPKIHVAHNLHLAETPVNYMLYKGKVPTREANVLQQHAVRRQ